MVLHFLRALSKKKLPKFCRKIHVYKLQQWRHWLTRLSYQKRLRSFRTSLPSLPSVSLPNAFCHIQYKQVTALLLCFTLLIAAGIFDGRATVAADTTETPVFGGYTIYMDEQEIGTAEDLNHWYQALHQTEQSYAALYAMDVHLMNDIRIFRVYEEIPLKYADTETLAYAVKALGRFEVEAVRLTINGEEIGVFRSEAEVQELLDRILEPYLQEADSTEFETVSFEEQVELTTVYTDFSKVADSDQVFYLLTAGSELEETYTVEQGDSMWSIVRSLGMTLEELYEMNPGLNDKSVIRPGQELRLVKPHYLLNVVTVEITAYMEIIPFETETRKDDSMYANQSKILQRGVRGSANVEARIVKRNGIEQEREILSREIIEAPVTRIVAQGTKRIPPNVAVARAGGRLLWPATGRITSPFGRRWGSLHAGIDIANSSKTPIYAAEAGRVFFSAYNGGYGNLIKIDHGGSMVTYYAHLRTRLVSSGTNVTRGELIGYMGSTGNSTGPHLHFEVRINGTPVDPMRYLR